MSGPYSGSLVQRLATTGSAPLTTTTGHTSVAAGAEYVHGLVDHNGYPMTPTIVIPVALETPVSFAIVEVDDEVVKIACSDDDVDFVLHVG